jgi:hypothetical protein
MNYIALINHFWNLNKEDSFTPNQTAVYFGILDNCNMLRWKNPFNETNGRFCSKLCMSQSSFSRARKILMERGLIEFKAEIGRSGFVSYAIKYPHKKGANESISEGVYDNISEGIYNTNLSPFKHKQKHKLNKMLFFLPNEEKSFAKNAEKGAAENFSLEKEGREERKKGSAQKKKEESDTTHFDQSENQPHQSQFQTNPINPTNPKKKTVSHRSALVEIWFNFYERNYKFKPTFSAIQGASLNRILLALEQRLILIYPEWTEADASQTFNTFLAKAHADIWLSRHFLLSNLEQQFDTILNHETQPYSAQRYGTTYPAPTYRSRGGTIADMQALKRK